MREATDIARQANAVLAFEPEMSNVAGSARQARRLLDEIGSPHLKVTIDPANLFHAGELSHMREILDELLHSWARTSCWLTPRTSITMAKPVIKPRVRVSSITIAI